MSSLRNRLEGLIVHFIGVVLMLAVLLPLFPTLSALEGRLLPVSESAKIVAMEPAEDGGTLLRLVFEVKRQCDFDHVVWNRILPDGTLEAVKVTWANAVGSRGVGRHLSQTWHIAMPINEIEGKSLAYVWHSCHPGWKIVSQFYP